MCEHEQFAEHIREIHLKFSRIYAQVFTQEKISLPQYALLNSLASYGDMTMTEASEKLHISKPAVTYLVDRLEDLTYLRRGTSSKDRRIYRLQILPKGQRLVRRVQGKALDLMLTALNRFKDEEKQIIDQFYAALSMTMDQVLSTTVAQGKEK